MYCLLIVVIIVRCVNSAQHLVTDVFYFLAMSELACVHWLMGFC